MSALTNPPVGLCSACRLLTPHRNPTNGVLWIYCKHHFAGAMLMAGGQFWVTTEPVLEEIFLESFVTMQTTHKKLFEKPE